MSFLDRLTERKWETKKDEKDVELKPCPFCGKRGKLTSSSGYVFVECIGCHTTTSKEQLVASAVALWNRRV